MPWHLSDLERCASLPPSGGFSFAFLFPRGRWRGMGSDAHKARATGLQLVQCGAPEDLLWFFNLLKTGSFHLNF